MAVTLTPEVQQRIERRLSEGKWVSASEVMSRALDLLDEMEHEDLLSSIPAERLKALLDEADDAERRGAMVTPAESRARIERLRAGLVRG